MILNSSIGKLIYSDNPYKLIVSVESDIGDFYRSLIPKYLDVRKPMHAPHISTVRNETPNNLSVWGKYEGQDVEFQYDSFIYNDDVYYWINCFSSTLEEIRQELGLPTTSQFTRSPDGKHKFHITIGNIKHLKKF